MKTLFGMTAAVLLLVSMLFVSLPGTGRAAAGKVTLAEMVKIKKAADEAAQAAKAQVEKAKTAEEKRLAKQLVKQAESNAEVASDLLEAVKAGEEVDREEAEACAAIAKAVHEAAGALAAGNMGRAEGAMGRIGELGSSLPTAGNARAEMQRGDGAGKKPKPPITPPKKPPVKPPVKKEEKCSLFKTFYIERCEGGTKFGITFDIYMCTIDCSITVPLLYAACGDNFYKEVQRKEKIGFCCLNDTACNDNNECTSDACVNETCVTTPIHYASPSAPNQCP